MFLTKYYHILKTKQKTKWFWSLNGPKTLFELCFFGIFMTKVYQGLFKDRLRGNYPK
jgi:hypothetical protein